MAQCRQPPPSTRLQGENWRAFIDPPQGEVIEKILRHCGLWRHSTARPPPDVEGLVHDLDGCFSDSPTGSFDQAGELTFVDMDTFLATF